MAYNLFERSLTISPDNPDIHSFQAITCLHLEKYMQAIQHSKIADEKYGYSPVYGATYFINKIMESYTELGKSYGMLKNYKASIEAFDKALSIIGPNAEIYTAMGTTYSLAGDKKEAIYFYKKALDIDPSYESARQKLLKEQSQLK